MRRLTVLIAALTLGLTAPVAAWVELPPHAILHGGVADCLRAAGPGRLTLLGRLSRTTSATDLFSVGPHGVSRTASTTLGWLGLCPETGFAPSAAPLLVAPTIVRPKSFEAVLRAADAGASPATIGDRALFGSAPSVAVAPNGAAVIAWNQTSLHDPSLLTRVLATVRPRAGAPFSPPATLGEGSFDDSDVAVGIDSTGVATVAWVSHALLRGPSLLHIATATDGRSFSTPLPLASAAGRQVALAVAPGGRTLVANYGGSNALTLYERAPGAATFAPVPVPTSQSPDEVAIALEDDGAAMIAYRPDQQTAFALTRRAGSDFGHEQLLEGASSDGSGSFDFIGLAQPGTSRPAPPGDPNGGQMSAALGANGQVVLTWIDPGNARQAASAHLARGTIAGGIAHTTRFGSPCRAANTARPLTLADGTPGAAWTDNTHVDSQDDQDTPLGGGLLHVVVPGRAAGAATAAAPGLAAQLIGPRALHGGQALHLRVRCRRGPCIVRAAGTTYGLDRQDGETTTDAADSVAVARGGSAVLTLDGFNGESFAKPHRQPATISLLACSTTGRGVTRLTLRPRLRRLPLRPLPRVLDFAAHRKGSTIHVTWRASIPAQGDRFVLLAEPIDFTHPAYANVPGRGRRRFSVMLHGSASHAERAVSIYVSNSDQSSEGPTARLR